MCVEAIIYIYRIRPCLTPMVKHSGLFSSVGYALVGRISNANGAMPDPASSQTRSHRIFKLHSCKQGVPQHTSTVITTTARNESQSFQLSSPP